MTATTASGGLFTRMFDAERARKLQYAAKHGVTVAGNRVFMAGRPVAMCPTDWHAVDVAYALARVKEIS